MSIIELYPTEEESAAAMAAIACYLAEEEFLQSETIETQATPVAAPPTAAPAEAEEPLDPLSMMIIGPPPSEDESAAILAAISYYITEEDLELDQEDPNWQWSASRVLTHQEIFPRRCPQRPTWGNIEQLRRAGRGGTGIVGL